MQQPSPLTVLALSIAGLFLSSVHPGHAQISKGHSILINRGLQLQGLSIDDNFVTLSTYTNANYTSFCWLNEYADNSGEIQVTHSSRPDWMGEAPGVLPWSRWVKDERLLPPHITPYGGDEAPFMSQLIALQLGDEWNLNDDTTRNRLVTWFNNVRTNWPNTILYHNSWGSQIGDAQLADFYNRAQPDMLCFDTYPWRSIWDSSQPNHTGAPIAGPPSGWYGDLRRYREHARAAGIPLAIYRQTFHSVQDYDQTVFRDPSRSELRLNTFAGLAFNVKFFTDFIYNTGANSLFYRACNWCGDSVIATNGLYAELSDINLRARNLGKALVRLTAVTTEGIPGYTTSMMFIRGRDGSGALNAIPVGFMGDQDSGGGNASYTDWVYQRNDPYLTNNWSVVNQGTKNNGQPGDVIVSWFKPLDESFDGPDYTNQVYMMVVNGLTDPSGTPEECRQEIRLNFHSSLGAVEMLNPLTSVAELQLLPLTNGLRQLVLNLNGGDGVLFKFANGAPFAGVQTTPLSGPPVMTLHPTSRSNILGTAATFTAHAAGSALLNYQWQFNGVNIPGATTNAYTVANVQFTNAGNYSVMVSNGNGTVSSASAALTVLAGQPFFYEPFNYSNVGAPVSSNTPANWMYGGTGTNDLHVTSGSLSYPGLAVTGNSVTNGGVGLGVRRLFGTNLNSGTVYFSALFRINDLGYGVWNGASAQVGALTSPDNTSFRLAVLVKSNSPSGYVFGLQKGGSGVTAVFDTTEYHANDTVLLVGKYDFGITPNAAALWINPGSATLGSISDPGSGFITVNTGTDGLTIDRFNIRQNTAASVPAAMQWDELRVGRTWGDVTSLAPPAPALLTNVTCLPNGHFQFTYASGSMQNAAVFSSTDLVNWSPIGTPVQISPGLYQFTDTTATSHQNRYYQLRWP